MGMSPSDYWDGDPSLTRAYRKAHRYRLELDNQLLWLQGRYVYDAICEVSPILTGFAKKGTKPAPYTKEPYPLTEERLEAKQEEKFDKNKAYMEAFAVNFNKKFKKREEVSKNAEHTD